MTIHNNALHPSVMNNEAMSVYSGTLGTDKYVFFLIDNLVMAQDGSSKAVSGIIKQILVYDTTKITMTPEKILKIHKYLKSLPYQSVTLTKDVNNNYVFDENDKLTFTCGA
jgi:hypothetical protein